MYHPVMAVRPDGIVRSGIIQPFDVRTMDPVQFARREIDPFINAVRHQAADYSPGESAKREAALGIVATETVPGAFGAASVQDMPQFWRHGFGQAADQVTFIEGAATPAGTAEALKQVAGGASGVALINVSGTQMTVKPASIFQKQPLLTAAVGIAGGLLIGFFVGRAAKRKR